MATIAVLGASGGVGGEVLKELLKRDKSVVKKIVLLNRRIIPIPSSSSSSSSSSDTRVEQKIIDLSSPQRALETSKQPLEGTDCLMVTMGVGAPSKLPSGEEGQKELLKVDCDIPTSVAQAAAAITTTNKKSTSSSSSSSSSVRHVSLLSAVGANINSKYSSWTKTMAGGSWYAHVKGQVEYNITSPQLNFPVVSIFRPAAIIGNAHTGGLGSWLMPKFDLFLPKRLQSIEMRLLGKAMVDDAINQFNNYQQQQQQQASSSSSSSTPKLFIYEGSSIRTLTPTNSSSGGPAQVIIQQQK